MKIHEATTPMLESLIKALRHGGLAPPYAPMTLERFGLERARELLVSLSGRGLGPGALAAALELVLEERASATPAPELVWTGPSVGLGRTRDTHVVVEDLFRRARHRVLLAGYVVYQGQKLFSSLRRETGPPLAIKVVLNVRHDEDPVEVWRRFTSEQWPDGLAPPKVYFDPRAAGAKATDRYRPSMHAKTVVVDGVHALVTSANFTEAAHRRNIEAGVLLHDPGLARAMEAAFEDLITHGHLEEIRP